MAYTATTARGFRDKKGTLSKKLGLEFAAIKVETDALGGRATSLEGRASSLEGTVGALRKEHYHGLITPVVLNGGGSETVSNVFVPVEDIEITKISAILTEAYVKDTTDAKIEIKLEDDTVVATLDLDEAGVDKGEVLDFTIEDNEEAIDAAELMKMVITETDSGGGTGAFVLVIEYKV